MPLVDTCLSHIEEDLPLAQLTEYLITHHPGLFSSKQIWRTAIKIHLWINKTYFEYWFYVQKAFFTNHADQMLRREAYLTEEILSHAFFQSAFSLDHEKIVAIQELVLRTLNNQSQKIKDRSIANFPKLSPRKTQEVSQLFLSNNINLDGLKFITETRVLLKQDYETRKKTAIVLVDLPEVDIQSIYKELETKFPQAKEFFNLLSRRSQIFHEKLSHQPIKFGIMKKRAWFF